MRVCSKIKTRLFKILSLIEGGMESFNNPYGHEQSMMIIDLDIDVTGSTDSDEVKDFENLQDRLKELDANEFQTFIFFLAMMDQAGFLS
jgi:hypothetical protein